MQIYTYIRLRFGFKCALCTTLKVIGPHPGDFADPKYMQYEEIYIYIYIYKYMQIYPNICKYYVCKYMQYAPNNYKYIQLFGNIWKYVQLSEYKQIYGNMY